MKTTVASLLAGLLAAGLAHAQQPAPPAPSFAAPNLTPKGVQSMAGACAMCHGTNGKPAANSTVAALAGRPRDEIVQSMAQFKAGSKPATIMHQVARGYSDAEVAALADYFSKLPR
jgi:cytochrome subunit of sulfide dehydrogenase